MINISQSKAYFNQLIFETYKSNPTTYDTSNTHTPISLYAAICTGHGASMLQTYDGLSSGASHAILMVQRISCSKIPKVHALSGTQQLFIQAKA